MMNARLRDFGLLGILSVLAQIVVTPLLTKDAFDRGKSAAQSGLSASGELGVERRPARVNPDAQ